MSCITAWVHRGENTKLAGFRRSNDKQQAKQAALLQRQNLPPTVAALRAVGANRDGTHVLALAPPRLDLDVHACGVGEDRLAEKAKKHRSDRITMQASTPNRIISHKQCLRGRGS